MLDLLLREELQIFMIAGALVFGFLILEIILMFLGLSDGGGDAPDGPQIDIETDMSGLSASEIAGELSAEFDIDADIASKISLDIQEAYADIGPDTSSPDEVKVAKTSLLGSLLDLLGLRALPLSVSLALFCAFFASTGLSTQILFHALFETVIGFDLLGPIAFVVASVLTKRLSGFVARLIPRDETSAISERSLGRRRGVVTVGTARRGSPAQVKVTDGFGNTHYIMVEPLSAKDEIPEGSEVLVLRLLQGEFRLVRIS